MDAVRGEVAELSKLLKEFDTALLTTVGADGHFHTRPMAMQKVGDPKVLWFCTSLDSQKAHDLEEDDHCAIALYKGGHDSTYVSLSGTAELVRDRQKIHELYDPSWKPWFPEGPDQADLVLIKFRPEHAEYVHPTTGKLQVLFTMVKSLITHERAEPAPKKELDALQ